jgi:hypothetical protein
LHSIHSHSSTKLTPEEHTSHYSQEEADKNMVDHKSIETHSGFPRNSKE